MRYLRWTLLGLLGLVGTVMVVGWLLPVRHVASRTTNLAAPPDRVYSVINDVESYPGWRSGVTRVEKLESPPDLVRFREHSGSDAITMEIVEARPSSRLVTRIADSDLPFGGTWTFDIVPAPDGSALTITERGEVYNPIFRFVSRFVIGHHSTIDGYLGDLAARVETR